MRLRQATVVPSARPPRSPQRQQLHLLGLSLGILTGILLVFAAVVREGFRSIAMAELRSQLNLMAEDFSSLPLPIAVHGRSLAMDSREMASSHQQVEWFNSAAPLPLARLGQVRSLGALPRRSPGERQFWQEQSDTLAIVLPLDAGGLDADGRPRIWLRVSQGLEPLHARMRQLDLALAAAIGLAVLLSAASAQVLAQRVVEPLELSLRRLRDFGLDASHELRGPLAALAANAEMGLLDCAADDHRQRGRFTAILSATDQMQRLVEDLLQMARQDQRRLEAQQRLDLADLAHQQLALYVDAFALRQQPLELDLRPGVFVLGQPSLLGQLVRNLLDNAHRHSHLGARIEVRVQRRGAQACLTVSDDGPGIAAEQLPQVFERFWRASADRNDAGNGMGLAIAARIAEVHGGTIQVRSVLGQGSCFEVMLPLTNS